MTSPSPCRRSRLARPLLCAALAGLFAVPLPALAAEIAPAPASVRALVDRHLADNGSDLLLEFREFLALPNVATVPADMQANAAWIENYLGRRGFRARSVSAGGAPYVLATRPQRGATKTVLIYAHFDGQPVEPANWATPPFEPTLKDGDTVVDWARVSDGELSPQWRLYARSAGDDKGPIVALMHAIDALQAADAGPKVNVKLILDGEEEIGSPTVERILAAHADELAADVMLFCDGPMHQSGRRQLVFGVRGSAGVHLTTYGPSRPLHSGHYGNWAPHPTDTMMRLLTSLKDSSGRVQVSGYVDEVPPVSDAERAAIAAMPPVDEALREALALGHLDGDGERLELLLTRPAINIVGFQAGGVGKQARNIIVPTASASLDLRLVPGQTVAHVRRTLEAHFAAQGFHVTHSAPSPELRRAHRNVLRVDWDGGYPAFRSALDGAAARELSTILTALDGTPPLLTPTMGGSLPIYLFAEALDMPIVILPIANHDNNQHGRDENIRLSNLFAAVGVYAAVLSQFGQAP